MGLGSNFEIGLFVDCHLGSQLWRGNCSPAVVCGRSVHGMWDRGRGGGRSVHGMWDRGSGADIVSTACGIVVAGVDVVSTACGIVVAGAGVVSTGMWDRGRGGRASAPFTARWILNHRMTREVLLGSSSS